MFYDCKSKELRVVAIDCHTGYTLFLEKTYPYTRNNIRTPIPKSKFEQEFDILDIQIVQKFKNEIEATLKNSIEEVIDYIWFEIFPKCSDDSYVTYKSNFKKAELNLRILQNTINMIQSSLRISLK